LAPVAGNAIRACAARLKWAYLRYDPVVPAQWQAVTGIFVLAERAEVTGEAFMVSEVVASSSTAEQEFAKTLVLAASLRRFAAAARDCRAPHRPVASRLFTQQSTAVRYFIDRRTDGPRQLSPRPGTGRGIALSGLRICQFVADLNEGPHHSRPGPALRPELVCAALHLLRYWSHPRWAGHTRSRDAARGCCAVSTK
jgi:hypothetical protein